MAKPKNPEAPVEEHRATFAKIWRLPSSVAENGRRFDRVTDPVLALVYTFDEHQTLGHDSIAGKRARLEVTQATKPCSKRLMNSITASVSSLVVTMLPGALPSSALTG